MGEAVGQRISVDRMMDTLENMLQGKVPSNIEEIEDLLWEAMLSNEFDWMSATADKFKAFLSSKGISSEIDVKELAGVLLLRIENGKQTFLKRRLKSKEADARKILEKYKDRKPIKDVVEPGWLVDEIPVYVNRFMEQDAALAEGKSFAEMFDTIVYGDCPIANLVFLLLIEEKSGQKIDSPERLRDVARLSGFDFASVSACYCISREEQLAMSLAKALRMGAKWNDLVAVSPGDFDLPKQWVGMREGEKVDILDTIRRVIYFHFRFNDEVEKPSVREVAKCLGAPYGQILRASMSYS